MKTVKYLAGNWKMFKNKAEVEHFFQEIGLRVVQSPVRTIICASPTLLETAQNFSTGTGIEIFSQNCAWTESGAFTGEISPLQLCDIGIKGTLVGHSERRQFFGDTDETCAKRARAALSHELEVIYCIGESLEDRKGGKTATVLESQLKALIPVAKEFTKKLIVAYEPIWAIGTGLTADSEQIVDAHTKISQVLEASGLSLPILYGGSVKPNNFKEISHLTKVAGGLVGGASLDAKSYIELHNCL